MHEEFNIQWTPEEQAKIEECRSWAAARRMLQLSNKGKALHQAMKNEDTAAKMRRFAKEVYRVAKGS